MCEANVYVRRNGQEELFMERVDRIVPGTDDSIFMENIFGERRVVKARIQEMELVHHRILLEEIKTSLGKHYEELWLDLGTEHGHFHEGEEVTLKVYKGYNMNPNLGIDFLKLQAFMVDNGQVQPLKLQEHHGVMEITLGRAIQGLAQIYVHEKGEPDLYATVLVEVGHHHHGIKPVGLPLEIVPSEYSHARLGSDYGIQVLKDGQPLVGAEVRVTYNSTDNSDYPYHLTTDAEGRARLFLTAHGDYLFSVTDGNVISTYTLIKNF